jgi:hypothetical protein
VAGDFSPTEHPLFIVNWLHYLVPSEFRTFVDLTRNPTTLVDIAIVTFTTMNGDVPIVFRPSALELKHFGTVSTIFSNEHTIYVENP